MELFNILFLISHERERNMISCFGWDILYVCILRITSYLIHICVNVCVRIVKAVVGVKLHLVAAMIGVSVQVHNM